MWRHKRWYLFLGVLALVVLVLTLTGNTGTRQVSDEADKFHLRRIAESIYEHYALTGKWPGKAGDLRKTSLGKLPYDIPLIEDEHYVVLWGEDLKPNPKENGQRLLVYAKGGPLRRGWKWVCWGDFRTEYLSEEQLQAVLQGAAK